MDFEIHHWQGGFSPSFPLFETHEVPNHQHWARVGELGWLNVTPQPPKNNPIHRVSRPSITLLGSNWPELTPAPPSQQPHSVSQSRGDHPSPPWGRSLPATPTAGDLMPSLRFPQLSPTWFPSAQPAAAPSCPGGPALPFLAIKTTGQWKYFGNTFYSSLDRAAVNP